MTKEVPHLLQPAYIWKGWILRRNGYGLGFKLMLIQVFCRTQHRYGNPFYSFMPLYNGMRHDEKLGLIIPWIYICNSVNRKAHKFTGQMSYGDWNNLHHDLHNGRSAYFHGLLCLLLIIFSFLYSLVRNVGVVCGWQWDNLAVQVVMLSQERPSYA